MDKQMTFPELFPEEFGEKKSEISQKKVTPEREMVLMPRLYWQYSLEVVNAWARYQAVKKLHINASHPETRPAVQDVLDDKKYYNGSMHRVYDHKLQLFNHLCALLREYKEICGLYRVEPVGLNWLQQNLKAARDYASYRGKCRRRRDSEKRPVSLKKL